MLGARIDRLASKHPAFRKYVGERIDIFFGTSLHTNINICITAGIAAGLLFHSENDVLKWGAVTVMLLVWAAAAMLAGFLKQWFFIAFEAVYFFLPQILIIPDSGEAMRETQYFVSDITKTVWAAPLEGIFPDFGYQTAGYIFLGACLLIFFVGFRLRAAVKHSELYCRKRLGQLE